MGQGEGADQIAARCQAPRRYFVGYHAGVFVAALGSTLGDPEGFGRLAAEFAARNPGYALDHLHAARAVPRAAAARLVFFHGGEGEACTERGTSPFALGDVAVLRAGESVQADAPFAAVVFTVPGPLPQSLPPFLRPDADPRIADQPGGCATNAGAYRRVLLTWRADHGPYTCHALNAHRVRMDDSFSHYHPAAGGFDELYLVQGAPPGAAVLHSAQVARILQPERVSAAEARTLVQRVPVAAGDLVYIPRGEMHRGIGGVLAHVITVPGFVPEAEIGLDAELRAINERLGLCADEALPFHRG